MLKLLELYLLPYGFSRISITSGHEAVVYVLKEYVDLIIMDVLLPGKDKTGFLLSKRNDSHTIN
jgi:DNA-binding response OmpR family regulator